MSVRIVSRNSRVRRTRANSVRVLAALTLGVCAALLASCSGSSKGLIPTSDAGPLQSDFEAVAHAAEEGNGSCTSTESALLTTEQDFARLPSSVDSGLRDTLTRGIENLRTRSLALCAQPLPQATTTQTTPKTSKTTGTTPPPTTSTETQTTSTQTTTQAPPSPSGPGGGTQAPGEETHAGEAEGANPGGNEGSGGAGGARAGGASFGYAHPGNGFGNGHGGHGRGNGDKHDGGD